MGVEIEGEAQLGAISMHTKGVMINNKWYTVVGPATDYMKNLKLGGNIKYKIVNDEVVFIQPIGQVGGQHKVFEPKPKQPQVDNQILERLDEQYEKLKSIDAKLEVITPPGQVDKHETELLFAFIDEKGLIEEYEAWKSKASL